MASTHLLLHTTNEAGADQLVEALRARVAKLGGDRVLDANVDLAYGFDRTDTAGRRALERARAGYRTVFGAGSFPEALVLELVANAYLRDEPERRDGIALWWQAYAIYKQLGLEDTAWPIEPTLDPQLRIARFAQLVEIASQQAPGSAELAQLEYALGTAYTFVPDWPRVDEHLERAIALFDRLAITSDDAAMAHALDTEALLRLHRTADVPPLARRAIAIAEPIHANPVIVIARQTLGHALIELKDYDGARAALEPLLPLHEQLRDSSASRGRTSFLLALATWTVDHKRAIGYAYAARRDYQSSIDAPFAPGVTPAVIASEMKLLDQIDAWIAKHPP